MRVVVVLICFILTATSAYALDMNAEVNDSDGAVYMNLWGTIEHGDDQEFRAVLLPYIRSGKILFKVNIFSVGGDVQAAMGIGDQIRTARGITTGPLKWRNTWIVSPFLLVRCSAGFIPRRTAWLQTIGLIIKSCAT